MCTDLVFLLVDASISIDKGDTSEGQGHEVECQHRTTGYKVTPKVGRQIEKLHISQTPFSPSCSSTLTLASSMPRCTLFLPVGEKREMYEHPIFCLASQVMDLTIREYLPPSPFSPTSLCAVT